MLAWRNIGRLKKNNIIVLVFLFLIKIKSSTIMFFFYLNLDKRKVFKGGKGEIGERGSSFYCIIE